MNISHALPPVQVVSHEEFEVGPEDANAEVTREVLGDVEATADASYR